MSESDTSKRVLVILGEGFEDAEATVLISALRWTEYRKHLTTVSVTLTGLRPRIVGRFGSIYETDISIEEVNPDDFDALVIPGGFKSRGFEELYDERVLSIVRAFGTSGKPIATLCVGVFVLGEAGLLEGKRATVYELSANKDNLTCLAGYGAEPTHEQMSVDGNLISCTGPRAAERVARHLMEMLIGVDATSEVYRFREGLLCM